jgi:alpha-D-ribose 1-methylphosphonate 5-phosphate C-P lyase
LHHDIILDTLDKLTTTLGSQLRSFQKHTCSDFKTYELNQEASARQRRHSKKKTKTETKKTAKIKGKESTNPSRKVKSINLATYKIHALGDYVDTIRMFGPTDLYSTELVISEFLMYVQFTSIGRA